MHAKTWSVEVQISEEDAVTKARAVLVNDELVNDETRLHVPQIQGQGVARVHPGEPNVPEIGDELATSRALSALSDALLETALDDVADVATGVTRGATAN